MEFEIFYENLAHFMHGMAAMLFLSGSVFMYFRRKESRLTNFLFIEMVFWSFVQLKDIDYLFPGVWDNVYVSGIQLSIDMWCIPVTALLFFDIISPKWVTVKRVSVVMAPSVAFTAAYIITRSYTLFQISLMYANIIGILTVIIVLFASSRYDNFIKRNFSYIENISLSWVRKVISIFFILMLVWTVIMTDHASSTWLNDVTYYIILIMAWTLIIYFTVRHQVVEEVPDYINPFSHENITARPEANDKFIFEKQFLKAMEEDKMYLNPKLTVAEIAKEIGTNRSYLSEYINGHLGVTFYEYVNSLRVAEAKNLLSADDGSRSLEQIAEECGFNSPSTFRRSFIRQTGMTPHKFRKDFGGI